MQKIRYTKKRYAKNTYGPKCRNTHGPKLWLLDTWAWADGPGPWPPPGKCVAPGWGGGGGQGPWAQGRGPRPMCLGAKALAHEYFDIWAHKYF